MTFDESMTFCQVHETISLGVFFESKGKMMRTRASRYRRIPSGWSSRDYKQDGLMVEVARLKD